MKEETFRLSDCDSYSDYRFKTNFIQRVCKFLAERELKPDKSSTLLAAESLLILNSWARRQYDSEWRYQVYQFKSQFLQIMYAKGYLRSVEPVQQILKCHRCTNGIHTSYYYESGDIKDQESCWHCNGDGIYKRVLLLAFHVKVAGKEFVWHQPADRVDNSVPLLTFGNRFTDIESLPVFKEPAIYEWTQPSQWMFQRHLLRLVVYVVRNQMFAKLELCDWKSALRSDVSKFVRRIGRWTPNMYRFHIKPMFNRKEEGLPF